MLLHLLQLSLILKQMADCCVSIMLSRALLPFGCHGCRIPFCHPITALICLPIGIQLT